MRNSFLTALFPAAICLFLLLGNQSLALDIPTQITVAQATADGVDIGLRVAWFYKALAAFSLCFALAYYGIRKLALRFALDAAALMPLAALSVTGTLLLLASVFGLQGDSATGFIGVLYAVTLVLTLLRQGLAGVNRALESDAVIPAIFSLAFILQALCAFLFNGTILASAHPLAVYTLWVAGLCIYAFLVQKRLSLEQTASWHIFKALAFTPLLVFLAVEVSVFAKLRLGFYPGYKGIFFALLLTTFIFQHYFRKKETTVDALLSQYFVPGALFSFVLLTHYSPVQTQSTELFEFANSANAQMRMFRFGEIPCVDFMSSHLFSEQFYGILHDLIYGYKGTLDFTVYKFFYQALFFGVAYLFMRRVLGSAAFAGLFLIAFPLIFPFFSVHIFWGILAFWAVERLFEKQDFRRYLYLWLGLAGLIFWRLDTGSAALFALLVYLPLRFYAEDKRPDFKTLFSTLALVAGLILSGAGLFALLRSPQTLWANFLSAWHYTAANQAHGYSSLAQALNQQFYLYHTLLPLFAVLAVFALVFAIKNKVQSGRELLHTSLFLFLLCLGNFQRGLVRHSFMEGTEHFLISVFFLALALFVLAFSRVQDAAQRYSLFFTVGLLSLLSLKYFPIRQEKTLLEKYFSAPQTRDLERDLSNPALQCRVVANTDFAKEQYTDLKDYLDKNLSAEQTFLDFSNTPMLYYYCQRRVPAYFCQNLQNTVDDYLQLEHLKQVNPETTPVVVFSRYPPREGSDASDGIPNLMRYYLIAEYIYQNYQPLGIISNKSIWISKGRAPGLENPVPDTTLTQCQTFPYKKIALYTQRFLEHNPQPWTEKIGEVQAAVKAAANSSFDLSPEVATCPAIFAKIQIENPADGKSVRVKLLHDQNTFAQFDFETSTRDKNYVLRLSNAYGWSRQLAQKLVVEHPEGMKVGKIEFFKDKRR